MSDSTIDTPPVLSPMEPGSGGGGNKNYGASSIQLLKGLEAVRKRPGMYIGDTDDGSGLHHAAAEIIDNGLDEAQAGYATSVDVRLEADGSVTVTDDGRGIPCEMNEAEGRPAIELVFMELHAGGKFDQDSYKTSGGLHGVGAAVVNALSSRLTATVWRDGREYHIEFSEGDVVVPLSSKPDTSGRRGTRVNFMPSRLAFRNVLDFSFDLMESRLRQLAFLNSGVRIRLTDARPPGQEVEFHFMGGMAEFVRYIDRKKTVLGPKPISGRASRTVEREGKSITIEVDFSVQWNAGYDNPNLLSNLLYFTNNIQQRDGGTHAAGFSAALTTVVNKYIDAAKGDKPRQSTDADDVREGMTAVISVKVPDPKFSSQTKDKLVSSEAQAPVQSVVAETIRTFLEENPAFGKVLVEKVIKCAEARAAAKRAKDNHRKQVGGDSMSLPGKLAGCEEKDPAKSEIYLVEGDSAGGCLEKDTVVPLLDGTSPTIAEIVERHARGEVMYVYSMNPEGNVEARRILNAWMTKRDAPVVKVNLDNNESFSCTPCHPCMTRNNDYESAGSLQPGTSLMPLVRRVHMHNGMPYEQVRLKNGQGAWHPTHWIAMDENIRAGLGAIQDGWHRHHKNGNSLDNTPYNIVALPAGEHLAIHSPESIAAKKTPEYRMYMSERMKELSPMLSERAKAQWEDEVYKDFMTARWREFYDANPDYRATNASQLDAAQRAYWSSQENRDAQSQRTTAFYEANPDAVAQRRDEAIKQWDDPTLRVWRAEETRKQWTPEFTAMKAASASAQWTDAHRAEHGDKTRAARFANSMELLNSVGHDGYEAARKAAGGPGRGQASKKYVTLSKFMELTGGMQALAQQGHYTWNHKVVSVEDRRERADVYDIEVEGLHNFALGCGVFVHNSAKQGRFRKFQAILPLKGKILNVEKATALKTISSEQITMMVAALGCGMGDHFNIDKLRYHRIILMTDADVDGAHIRTLLITFFYRCMPELIARGYIWIAQPPLFSTQRGKNGQKSYHLNKSVMDQSLIEAGCADMVLRLPDGTEFKEQQLLSKVSEARRAAALMEDVQVSLGLPKNAAPLVECLAVTGAWHPDVFADEQNAQMAVDYVVSLMGEGRTTARWSGRAEKDGLVFSWRKRGLTNTVRIPASAPSLPGVQSLLRALSDLQAIYVPAAQVIVGNGAPVNIYSPRELADMVLARGGQGLTVMRYKGLGEMSPAQLKSTTLDPQYRTMLQVTEGDPLVADSTCKMLMGDEVEPRRVFIVNMASKVDEVDA